MARTDTHPSSRALIPQSLEFAGIVRRFSRPRPDAGAAQHVVLSDVSITVAPTEVVAILGASGCGKSTLLRLAAGLDIPTSGTVRIGGSPVAGIDARCSVAFQEPRLLPWRTLAANVRLGLRTDDESGAGTERVAQLLALVGLTGFAGHRPREVSGGMAQRASLARALARRPSVLLLDEPFGSLDALTRLRMQDLLLDIHEAAPTTVVLVTHDVDEALYLADQIVVLGQKDGVEGSTVVSRTFVEEVRPRDRGAASLARLRLGLLADLGIVPHAPLH